MLKVGFKVLFRKAGSKAAKVKGPKPRSHGADKEDGSCGAAMPGGRIGYLHVTCSSHFQEVNRNANIYYFKAIINTHIQQNTLIYNELNNTAPYTFLAAISHAGSRIDTVHPYTFYEVEEVFLQVKNFKTIR